MDIQRRLKWKIDSRKGITLITLVITIIILLILASVAINLFVNDNGLFSKAKEAKFKTKISSYNEEVVRFIEGTSNEVDHGYTIPSAFWWDKNSNNQEDEGEQLPGYWAMKYTVGG